MLRSQSVRVILTLNMVFAMANSGSATLLHYYPMNETVNPSTGTTVADLGTTPVTATALGTVGPVVGVASANAGLFGTAFNFNSSDQGGVDLLTRFPGTSNVGGASDAYTVAAWIKPAAIQQAAAAILGSFSTNRGIDLRLVNGTGAQDPSLLYLQLYHRNNASGNVSSWGFDNPLSASAIDQWTHLAVTMNSSRLVQVYVNGALWDAGGTIGRKPGSTSTNDIAIGESLVSNSTSYYQGGIDEFRIYDELIDAATIAALAGVPEPSSMALLCLGLLGLVSRRLRKPWR